MSKHTPGPWLQQEKKPLSAYVIQTAGGKHIATVFSGPDDARLIASALELLEALRLAENRLIQLAEHDQDCDLFRLDDDGRTLPCSCGLTLAIQMARAAVDKANGEAQ